MSKAESINALKQEWHESNWVILRLFYSCFNVSFNTAIFKTDISDHFPVCFVIPSVGDKIENKTSFISKRILKADSLNAF